MNFTKTQTKDSLWHGGKALLCALQLFILDRITQFSVNYLLDFLLLERVVADDSVAVPLFSLIRPVTTVILFIVLWRYYDSIDDRSFKRFCDTYKDVTKPPQLLRDPAYMTGMVTTVLCAAPVLTLSLIPPLRYVGLRSGECIAVGVAVAFLLMIVISLLRIKRLAEVWIIQKDLRTGNEKTRRVRHIVKRIFYAVIFFGSLCALVFLGFGTLIPVWGSFFLGIIRLLYKPILAIATILFVWLIVIRSIRRMLDRRKFLKRLNKMRERGELSYEIHGHPYLSVFSGRVAFGLTITDAPHPDGKRKKDTTYKVAVANCKYRRGMVILCANNIYRFVVFSLNFRTIAQQNWGGLSVASSQIVSMPVGAIHTNHTFDFPEGEGKRILLVDPAPRILCMPGRREGEVMTLDNGSEIFGYTVYGKNSFVNLLERT